MSTQSRRTRPFGSTALVLCLLVLAAGVCMSNAHADGPGGHGIDINLCLGMLGVPTVVAPLLALTVLGWAAALMVSPLVPASLHVLDPPPKRFPSR